MDNQNNPIIMKHGRNELYLQGMAALLETNRIVNVYHDKSDCWCKCMVNDIRKVYTPQRGINKDVEMATANFGVVSLIGRPNHAYLATLEAYGYAHPHKEHLEQMQQLQRQGLNCLEIAKAIGIGYAAVYNSLHIK